MEDFQKKKKSFKFSKIKSTITIKAGNEIFLGSTSLRNTKEKITKEYWFFLIFLFFLGDIKYLNYMKFL